MNQRRPREVAKSPPLSPRDPGIKTCHVQETPWFMPDYFENQARINCNAENIAALKAWLNIGAVNDKRGRCQSRGGKAAGRASCPFSGGEGPRGEPGGGEFLPFSQEDSFCPSQEEEDLLPAPSQEESQEEEDLEESQEEGGAPRSGPSQEDARSGPSQEDSFRPLLRRTSFRSQEDLVPAPSQEDLVRPFSGGTSSGPFSGGPRSGPSQEDLVPALLRRTRSGPSRRPRSGHFSGGPSFRPLLRRTLVPAPSQGDLVPAPFSGLGLVPAPLSLRRRISSPALLRKRSVSQEEGGSARSGSFHPEETSFRQPSQERRIVTATSQEDLRVSGSFSEDVVPAPSQEDLDSGRFSRGAARRRRTSFQAPSQRKDTLTFRTFSGGTRSAPSQEGTIVRPSQDEEAGEGGPRRNLVPPF
ncbi:hypothetical protein C7M84_019884 [Penaeus vannamei]|uniref:Uncharacterized protein n=1 Tax=Penaeus vannamei TaxID=6689 RepID=A0A3R7LT87_PENVA|nr:hypothetical protein C7M84_019884 [Penaeus vannamei]